MANIFDAEFADIKTVVLRRIGTVLPFDIYIKRAENAYSKIFLKSEPLDVPRMDSYEQEKGISRFYVKRDDYQQYLLYVEQIANRAFANPGKEKKEDLINLLKEMVDLTMLEFVTHKRVDERSVAYAVTTTKGCVELLSSDTKSLTQVLKLMTSHPYLMKHALATSVFALILAKQSGMTSDKTLNALGLGSLLHDVGMSMLAMDIESKPELTPDEFKELKQHPELGKRLLDNIRGIPPEVREIVMQHHEQPNGNGYPNGLRANEIIHLAKIVAIADSFAALISARPFRPEPQHPLTALNTMQEDRGKFDSKLMAEFFKIFVKTK